MISLVKFYENVAFSCPQYFYDEAILAMSCVFLDCAMADGGCSVGSSHMGVFLLKEDCGICGLVSMLLLACLRQSWGVLTVGLNFFVNDFGFEVE